MTQITVHADCGHLPNDGHSAKKQLLRDLNIAFARAEVDEILALLSEDITWHIVGDAVLEGKAAVRQVLRARLAELTEGALFLDRDGAGNTGTVCREWNLQSRCAAVTLCLRKRFRKGRGSTAGDADQHP
ncbi:MAG: nuclear transport factor 2 family protein [Chloroflexi bacterium]|nr:nuclear transport factor 2 family protein [Chloroflexota bacterium]